MLGTFTAVTTKAIIGAAAVAVAGAGAVATVSAVGPKVTASQSAVAPASSNDLPVALTSPEPVETTEAAEPTPEATPETTTDTSVVYLTRAEAIAIAQARYPLGNVREAEFENEDGTAVWKIDLRTDEGARAKIWVDATTGAIVRERFKNAPAPKATNPPTRGDDDSDENETEDNGGGESEDEGEDD